MARRRRRTAPILRGVSSKIRLKLERSLWPSQSLQIATNAPYGFTVQGELTSKGAVTVTTTTGALTVPRLTTTQRNALTAAVGMVVYNTTDSKFQGYAGSSWVNLH